MYSVNLDLRRPFFAWLQPGGAGRLLINFGKFLAEFTRGSSIYMVPCGVGYRPKPLHELRTVPRRSDLSPKFERLVW